MHYHVGKIINEHHIDDTRVLSTIIERARATKSTSFLLIKERQVVVHWESDRPIAAHSITKSIVSLGIGILIDQGRISSVDQPVADWFFEWKEGPKQKVTLRHLLTHTSGLEAKDSGQEIYQSDDSIQLALSTDLVSKPGEAFFYNNKAVNLLSGIIEKVTDSRADLWIQEQLFDPLDIKNVAWYLDESGHAHAHAGLKIGATDLAKIGQLLLDQGVWNQKRLISKEWLEESMKAQTQLSSCGFLWWCQDNPVKMFSAIGYRGQYLIVIPQANIIAVRQTEAIEDATNAFEDLSDLLFQYLRQE